MGAADCKTKLFYNANSGFVLNAPGAIYNIKKTLADAKTMIVLISIIITDKGHSKKSIQQHTNAFEDLSTLSRS